MILSVDVSENEGSEARLARQQQRARPNITNPRQSITWPSTASHQRSAPNQQEAGHINKVPEARQASNEKPRTHAANSSSNMSNSMPTITHTPKNRHKSKDPSTQTSEGSPNDAEDRPGRTARIVRPRSLNPSSHKSYPSLLAAAEHGTASTYCGDCAPYWAGPRIHNALQNENVV